jgi:hypothetical protein
MKKTKHPIQLPDSLINKWLEDTDTSLSVQFQEAAEWGANAELEACCEWLEKNCGRWEIRASLRTARRPKPPSLKEQALDELHISFDRGYLKEGAADTIRRALEALPE